MSSAVMSVVRGFLTDLDPRWLAVDAQIRDHTQPSPRVGRRDAAAWWARLNRDVLADARNDPRRMTVDGSRVAIEWALRGRHVGSLVGESPSGRMVSLSIAAIFEIADEEIHRIDLYYDALGLVRQAAADPARYPSPIDASTR